MLVWSFVSIVSFQKDHFRKTIPALIIIEEKGKRGNVKVTLRGSALAYSERRRERHCGRRR